MEGIKFIAEIQGSLAVVRFAEQPSHWTFTCCRRGLSNLLGVVLKAGNRATFRLTAGGDDGVKFIGHVQGHLVMLHNAIDDGFRRFACSRRGLGQLLGRRLQAGDRVTFTLTASDVERCDG